MNMIYISHPYTGNEKDNRKAAAAIAAELAKKYPYILFVNPLDAMRHLKVAKPPYDTVLEQCKTLLGKCDGVIMAGNWKDSNGCMEEYLYAVDHQLAIWEGKETFDAEEVMPHDCCGTHAACKKCICKACAHRLACWNCNDCVQEAGQASPIGYTGGDIWKPSCSRYEKKG